MSTLRVTMIALFAALANSAWGKPAASPLHLTQTIPLPGVEGRLDHFAFDAKTQRLFAAALEYNTVEVIDLRASHRVHSIPGLHEPQGLLFIPEQNLLIVANGQGGAIDVFDGSSLQRKATIQLSDDADNMRYDAHSQVIYAGFGEGGLALVDANTLKQIGNISLGSHPESFQIENSGRYIFVNLPPNRVAVVDRESRKVVANWSLATATVAANYPMDLDETNHRLFIGTRKPAKLVVLDIESGKVMAKVDCVGDPDDIFYDSGRKRIYVSGGGGSVSVYEQRDPDHYRLLSNVPTAEGARSSLFVPASNRFYLAVPHRGSQPAEVRFYTLLP